MTEDRCGHGRFASTGDGAELVAVAKLVAVRRHGLVGELRDARPRLGVGRPGPFGEHDPEGATMGSVLFAARAEPTGLVMASCSAVGVIVAGAMRRPTGHRARRRVLLTVAWPFAITWCWWSPEAGP